MVLTEIQGDFKRHSQGVPGNDARIPRFSREQILIPETHECCFMVKSEDMIKLRSLRC